MSQGAGVGSGLVQDPIYENIEDLRAALAAAKDAKILKMSSFNLPPPEPFLVSEDSHNVAERWKTWVGRLEYFLGATDIVDDAKKVKVMITVVGPEVYEIFTNLPKGTKLDKFDDVKLALSAYFAPKANITYNRYLFSKMKQEEGECVDTFVTRLRKAAKACEFNVRNDIEDRIADQLVLY